MFVFIYLDYNSVVFRYVFTIVSYLIGVFIFATIVGQVGNVITNRNANRLEFERLLDGAKTYMRHHKVHYSVFPTDYAKYLAKSIRKKTHFSYWKTTTYNIYVIF